MRRTLILIPTELESSLLQPALQPVLGANGVEVRICGFGPIASGIRTSQLIFELQPSSCLLVGIAGAYGNRLAIGSAHTFSHVASYGIGAGSGSNLTTATELAWRQWPEPMQDLSTDENLSLPDSAWQATRLQMLTVCAASASGQDVEDRLKKFPNAVAEDMESFSVGLACRSAGIPLTVIRGISNVAGDRNKMNWKVNSALAAAANLTRSVIVSIIGK